MNNQIIWYETKEIIGWVIIGLFILTVIIYSVIDSYLNLSKFECIKKTIVRSNSKVKPL